MNFRSNTSEFRQLQIQKPKNLEDALQAIETLSNELSKTHGKLQDNFKKLQGAVGSSGNTTIILSGSSGSSSSESSSSSGIVINSGFKSLVAGSNLVSFPIHKPMTTDYVLLLEFYDLNGVSVGVSGYMPSITYSMSGFTIVVGEAGWLKYVAIPKSA